MRLSKSHERAGSGEFQFYGCRFRLTKTARRNPRNSDDAAGCSWSSMSKLLNSPAIRLTTHANRRAQKLSVKFSRHLRERNFRRVRERAGRFSAMIQIPWRMLSLPLIPRGSRKFALMFPQGQAVSRGQRSAGGFTHWISILIPRWPDQLITCS